jgi:large subunit ribosomal protein L18
MSILLRSAKEGRACRHRRLRKRVTGTADRPRMAISISNKNMYVQFIDDAKGVTLASTSTLGGDGEHNVDAARKLGQRAALVAKERGIQDATVDRGGHKFHGRVRALVEGAAAAGLKIGKTRVRAADEAEQKEEK